MPWYRMGHAMVHIRMGNRRAKPPPACGFFVTVKGERVRCMAMTCALCDWPGCDVPMCKDHALKLGPDLDVCPTHNHRKGLLSRLLPSPKEKTCDS
jgi:hypothetical protein